MRRKDSSVIEWPAPAPPARASAKSEKAALYSSILSCGMPRDNSAATSAAETADADMAARREQTTRERYQGSVFVD